MNEFKPLVYCSEKIEFTESYDKLLKNPLVLKYTMVKYHFTDLRITAEDWALCYRLHLLTRSHNTNNYSESAFRVFKDKKKIHDKGI